MEKIYFILKFCQLFLLQQPKVEKQLRFFLSMFLLSYLDREIDTDIYHLLNIIIHV